MPHLSSLDYAEDYGRMRNTSSWTPCRHRTCRYWDLRGGPENIFREHNWKSQLEVFHGSSEYRFENCSIINSWILNGSAQYMEKWPSLLFSTFLLLLFSLFLFREREKNCGRGHCQNTGEAHGGWQPEMRDVPQLFLPLPQLEVHFWSWIFHFLGIMMNSYVSHVVHLWLPQTPGLHFVALCLLNAYTSYTILIYKDE